MLERMRNVRSITVFAADFRAILVKDCIILHPLEVTLSCRRILSSAEPGKGKIDAVIGIPFPCSHRHLVDDARILERHTRRAIVVPGHCRRETPLNLVVLRLKLIRLRANRVELALQVPDTLVAALLHMIRAFLHLGVESLLRDAPIAEAQLRSRFGSTEEIRTQLAERYAQRAYRIERRPVRDRRHILTERIEP